MSTKSPPLPRPGVRAGFRRGTHNLGDRIFLTATFVFAALVLAILLLFVIELIRNSSQPISKFGFRFLWTRQWNPVKQVFGALPFIFGTLMSSFIALLLAVPVGIGTAIFLSEFAPPKLRGPLSFLAELLAAIPSIVYGLWGIFVLVPFIRSPLQPALKNTLGFLPVFSGSTFGISMLAAGIVLAIMIVPTITAISRDVMYAVPMSQREAMYSLGGTRWEVISQTVLPYARTGIIGGVILALGRALGETMAVTMVIGNRPEIAISWFKPAATLASVIANEFTEATYSLYIQSLIELGFILIGVTIAVNVVARLLVWRVTQNFRPVAGG